jgi:hypothetical protein
MMLTERGVDAAGSHVRGIGKFPVPDHHAGPVAAATAAAKATPMPTPTPTPTPIIVSRETTMGRKLWSESHPAPRA